MRTIKLDAIDSTNEFSKRSIKGGFAKDNDAVFAVNQTNGKGQMGAKWASEASKSLTCSVLLKFDKGFEVDFLALNATVCLSVREIVSTFCGENLIEIKWPNDIMAEGGKIAGLLIENLFGSNGEIWSIVGIGLNVNQEDFLGLPNATSMKNVSGKTFDVEEIFDSLTRKVISGANEVSEGKEIIWVNYHNHLYRKNEFSKFAYAKNGSEFIGKIIGVSANGKLVIIIDDTIVEFANKEILMVND